MFDKIIVKTQDHWVKNLEHVTFSLNIRPRDQSTGYSAFELMHNFRKARLPNEATDIFEKEVLGFSPNGLGVLTMILSNMS